MPDTAEHRGWEISEDYHEHFLDDADYDIAEDHSESGSAGIVLAIIAGVILAAIYLAGKWLEPPVLKFTIAPPMIRTVYVRDPNPVAEPLQACGNLPACPGGRMCQIDNQCNIVVH